jgi:hypothetical protein
MTYLAALPETERPACDAAIAECAQRLVDACAEQALRREQLGAEAFAAEMWPQVMHHTAHRTREEWSAAYEGLRAGTLAGKRRAA